ncbi:MAG: sigma-70 family RNA polymerase sigma factor [Clostridia bacterium]|nr:sigma-70 family RNA polymerase sigma factor [Clostridia bacterium]
MGLVRSICYRFRDRGVDMEDLIQIGSIGMLKAIRSFEVDRGNAFSTYCVPLIIGEIRRFLRDDGLIKVSRVYKRNGMLLMRKREELAAERGSEPHLSEVAEACGLSLEEATLALDATSSVHSISDLIGDDEEFTLEQTLAGENNIERRLEQLELSEAIGKLPPLWRKILYFRFYRELSQQQTADRLGLTQVKISREEKKIFSSLRTELAK